MSYLFGRFRKQRYFHFRLKENEFSRQPRPLSKDIKRKSGLNRSLKEHDYCVGRSYKSSEDHVINENWKHGRRLVEFDVLFSNLEFCKFCRLGPVALSPKTVFGELQKILGGYLYVRCENSECNKLNTVPYGKTHRSKTMGMPCFAINTKLGTGKQISKY